MAVIDSGKSISNMTAISVGAGAAVDLYSGIPRPAAVTIVNNGPAIAYLGGPSVNSTNGVPLLNGGDTEDEVVGGEELYAITSAATADIRIIFDLGTPDAI